MIRLHDIIESIKNDKNIDGLDIKEQIDLQTYYLLLEIMDINNIYPYEATDKFTAAFEDTNNIKHFIRIAYQPLNKIPDAFVVKFWFLDKNQNVSYDRPNVIFNLKHDEKILNTYIHILIKEFLEKQNFFEKAKEKTNRLFLPSTDYARYRLYRMALNKFIDKTKYKFYDDDHKNTIVIEPI